MNNSKKNNSNLKNDKADIKKLYGKESILSAEQFVYNNKVDINTGLIESQIRKHYDIYGKNELSNTKPKKWYQLLLASLINPFNLILIGIIVVLIYTDVYLSNPPSYANITVIIMLISLSSFLEFFIVYKSNRDAANLKELIQTTSTVIRNGQKQNIPVEDLTIGDVVILSAGDLIPGDLRLIESNNLYVSQSSLTGESETIEKFVDSNLQSVDEIESIMDLNNICFMGTNVTSGAGKGVICKIADDTYFGRISSAVNIRKTKNKIPRRNWEFEQIVNKVYDCNDSDNISFEH